MTADTPALIERLRKMSTRPTYAGQEFTRSDAHTCREAADALASPDFLALSAKNTAPEVPGSDPGMATLSRSEKVQPEPAGMPGVEACPFCGGPARTFRYNGAEQATCAAAFIECAGSDVTAPVAMWNRRALSQEVERLKRVGMARETRALLQAQDFRRLYEAAESRAEAAEARVKQAVEALEPFAKESLNWEPHRNDGYHFEDSVRLDPHLTVTVGDFRRARTAAAAIRLPLGRDL